MVLGINECPSLQEGLHSRAGGSPAKSKMKMEARRIRLVAPAWKAGLSSKRAVRVRIPWPPHEVRDDDSASN